MGLSPGFASDSLHAFFLAQGEQRATDVAARLAAFIGGTQQSLDLAIYDFRLTEQPAAIVAGALRERAAAGVAIRIAYDADKPAAPRLVSGMDPAPSGTGSFVRALGYPWRRIGGMKLMHQKYIVRDAALPTAAVWTGTSNFTDDSWSLQENNLLTIASPELATAYARDFAELWQRGAIEHTGDFVAQPAQAIYQGQPAAITVLFSPGCGETIDYDVARLVAGARRRVRIWSMLLNSGVLLAALGDLLRIGQAEVSGIYDETQMRSVLAQWQGVPHNHWKIGAIQDIIREAGLVGKHSTPYSPTSTHDFMHAKTLVVDDTVVTGSYNFSHSAELNAENILRIESAPLADAYSQYVDHLLRKYGGAQGSTLPTTEAGGVIGAEGGTPYG
ncbi:MAG: phosphatidylserine/phosphatidylglycerophosphate/cardiolipin synthase family protein [Ktedonobacterales bacterium]|nr:phosphatidylserine/phosphatidylglycerophosphate/cardiolipin synthase family protein [Ktedonobacterales bacterium]